MRRGLPTLRPLRRSTKDRTARRPEQPAEPEAGEETEAPADFGILTDIAGENGTT